MTDWERMDRRGWMDRYRVTYTYRDGSVQVHDNLDLFQLPAVWLRGDVLNIARTEIVLIDSDERQEYIGSGLVSPSDEAAILRYLDNRDAHNADQDEPDQAQPKEETQ